MSMGLQQVAFIMAFFFFYFNLFIFLMLISHGFVIETKLTALCWDSTAWEWSTRGS